MGNESLHHESILSGYSASNRRVCATNKILPLSPVWFPASFKCYWQNKGMIRDLPTLVKVRTRQDLAGSFGSYRGEERSYLWNVRFTPPVGEQVVWHCPAMYQTWQWSSRADLACLAWSKKAYAVSEDECECGACGRDQEQDCVCRFAIKKTAYGILTYENLKRWPWLIQCVVWLLKFLWIH